MITNLYRIAVVVFHSHIFCRRSFLPALFFPRPMVFVPLSCVVLRSFVRILIAKGYPSESILASIPSVSYCWPPRYFCPERTTPVGHLECIEYRRQTVIRRPCICRPVTCRRCIGQLETDRRRPHLPPYQRTDESRKKVQPRCIGTPPRCIGTSVVLLFAVLYTKKVETCKKIG